MTEDEKVKGRRHRDSGRIGLHLGRPTRTAHINFRSIQVGQSGGRGGSIDYITREGDYSDRDDLVHVAGDPDNLREAIAAVDQAAIWRRGRTAERVAIATVMELPADVGLAAHIRAAEAIQRYWQDQGHDAIVAVHHEPGNPHMHVLATARPTFRRSDGWEVDRRAPAPLRGKAAVREARRAMTDIVNETCGSRVRFWGGRDRDMDRPGIVGRKPERRPPQAVRHGRRPDEPHQIQQARERHQEARRQAQEAKLANSGRKRQKALRRAEKAGVPVELGKVYGRTDYGERLIVSRTRLDQVEREGRRKGAEAERLKRSPPAPLPELTEKQAAWVTDTHQKLGLELAADWHATAEGRAAAFGVARGAGRLSELIQQSAAKTPGPPAPNRPNRGRGRE